MVMDKEAHWFHIELFADIFTDFDQVIATLTSGAGCWFMSVFNAGQFCRQWFVPSGLGRRVRCSGG